ncbi:uncharacterized protein N7500_003551 [Penicillium coprophilum]|uniref:uncharacterized protein n=1 Tax=Penicillium coprophilum TaxID=36646 RepID=UPI0023953FF5|nr:uncharacterized protein N7500_003551 [Penicillium coprophilum]KAJ5170768.1 hypothetical protein N7500_003551 [Penicillium coprophilum]
MANPIPVYVEVFCTYCQIDGHEVVNCHAMYHYLSNILIATEMDTRKADQGTQPEVIKKTLCVAHWGQSKKGEV